MRWWSWLLGGSAGKNVPQSEQIWMTGRVRDEQVVARLKGAAPEARVILVVHFREDFDALQDRLRRDRVDLEEIEPRSPDHFEDLVRSPGRYLVYSDALKPQGVASTRPAANAPLELLMVSRPVRHTVDEQILAFARELASPVQLQVFSSLDDLLVRGFSGNRVRELLKTLGMAEEEAIESAMVTRQIRKAQKAFEKDCSIPADVRSLRDWIDRNNRLRPS